MADEESPVSLLVLGGLGMIGRNFVKYVVDYGIAQHVRVVDKAIPVMAYLSDEHKATFAAPSVEVVQANLNMAEHVDRAFAPSEKCPHPFHLVVNLAAETRYGLPAETYKSILDLRVLCAQKAAAMQAEKYIEVSTGQVYSGSKSKPAKETDATAPWTKIGEMHLAAERAIAAIPALNYVILRLPTVYGAADKGGLMPRIVCAATYQHTQQRMEFLWGEDLRVHTVHVQDVAACLWHLLVGGDVGETYNLADGNDTSQGKFNRVLEQLFQIETGFYGAIASTLAQIKLDALVEEANDGHMAPWDDMCRAQNIYNTPLSPYLHKELLYKHHLALDGAKLAATGFECSCPLLTVELVADSIDYWRKQNVFPAPQ
jgi:nucleoside-diphosphate-sugar epimerase